MDIFFNTLKKGLVATLFIVFAFVATYTPQLPTSQVEEAVAAGGLGNALEPTQLLVLGQNQLNVVQNTLNAAANVASWTKENVLDGIGWAIAKRIVSGIIRSLIDWVNSGFAGSPSFIQDFRGFLLNIADEEIGRVISELGDVGSFICSPFRLDVQISVALQYSRGREQQSAPTCTLTGILDNIEGFIQGVAPSDGNSLARWITITSQPKVYTKYGAALSAQQTARARLINAQGEEIKLLDFGDGFQSQKICRSVSGFTGSQDCSIVKPGRVIADQLNKALGAGQDSLIEADEINELIAALLGQLANSALTGVAGLLGLSGGDGFGGYSAGPSYLDDLYSQSAQNVDVSGGSGDIITEALVSENNFRNEALQIRANFVAFAASASSTPTEVAQANAVIADIDASILEANANIIELNRIESDYAIASDDQRIDLLIEFTQLELAGQSPAEIADWTDSANDLGIELD